MHTSKNTSMNSGRTPRGFKLLKPTGRVLDYGCGKYWQINAKYCYEKGATDYVPYDPYQEGTNCELANIGEFDTIYCTNVLNVLDNKFSIEEVIRNIGNLLAVNGTAIFTVYEGDKTSIGKETKPDCWQRNQPTGEYRWYFLTVLNRYKYEMTATKQYIKIKRTY